MHRGPPLSGVHEHVGHGRTCPTADEAHALRNEGERPLAGGGEQAFSREDPLQSLELGEEFADADGPDLLGPHLETAAPRPELRPGEDQDPLTCLDRGRHGSKECGVGDDGE